MNFREYIKNNRVLYDGAFSTYYAEINGKCLVPEMANIKDRETVLKIHKEYVDAGAVLIRTNTFEANTGSLGCDKEELKRSRDWVEEWKKNQSKYPYITIFARVMKIEINE